MPAKQRPIVVVGSLNMDLVAQSSRIPLAGETVLGTGFQTHPGGKGGNQAVAAARLGYPVAMIGRVGDDAFGVELRQSLRSAGVDVEAVRTIAGSSGIAVIVVAESGENSIVISPGANFSLTPSELDQHAELISSAGLVMAQLEIPMDTVEHLATLCRHAKVPFILDPAPARELSSQLLDGVTWLTPNETEANILLNQLDALEAAPAEKAAELRALGARSLILKMGANGVYVSAEGSEGYQIDPFRVTARDTTAAGDSFNGAFAVGLMLGKSERDSARFASAAAAISVTRPGAQPSMPSMDEVEAFVREWSKESQQ